MEKKVRNKWILDHMEDKGYGKDNTAQRRNLQNLLNKDRTGKDTIGDLMDAMAKMIESDEMGADYETLMKDLNDFHELCGELKDKLVVSDFERDGYKEKAQYYENINKNQEEARRKMRKQNAWMKQWIEQNLPTNNIKFRCAFSYEFGDKDWSNI